MHCTVREEQPIHTHTHMHAMLEKQSGNNCSKKLLRDIDTSLNITVYSNEEESPSV